MEVSMKEKQLVFQVLTSSLPLFHFPHSSNGVQKGFKKLGPAPLPFKILQFFPVLTWMKDTWHIKHLKVKKMPHQNIIYLHLTHPFHSAATSIQKPTSHVHQQSWRTDGKEPSEWCQRRHPLTPMGTNSNATKVLRLLYFYVLFS